MLHNSQHLICKYCEKSYSTNSHMNRHFKKCPEKEKDDECKKNMMDLVNRLNDQLKEKNKQLQTQAW